ncbi:tripartite tricarboxylate transporter substrate binding protein [Roseomonas marmotae]|uniref:Tripartite tricarboxylate transporter substrate binding protein n=1 Tax=Roseomonas marmotae TaxID=2768161 RepID=A0ABS3KGN2_9PROT|nr:tripartite tricarboxylate transporter substrate binding protein [Roseomonas marmotae]MBO1076085.1 tripartite tricarboxylate transporter substrate binding protein [Roseomonas marmotae]QTI81323.1 tripartite tricarboxylate transporter substrate binding protein [Roseomonas marmotae]
MPISITRRGLGILAAGGLAAPALAQEAAWPSRAVRIIVPFGAGGSADIAARNVAEALTQELGQPFVVENRPGAGATIGTEAAARAAPDGYTLLMMSNTHTANETLLPNRPYVLMRDLAAAAAVNVAHHVLAVHPSLGVSSVAELIAKAKAEPGKIDYASSGPGTPYHIAGEVFRAMAGIEIQHVPFRSSGEARTALISGTVPMMFDAIPTMQPHIAGNRARALATTGPQRDPLMPELPTVAESGLPGYEASIWLGLMVPAQTPRPVVERLNAATNGWLARPQTKAAMAAQGAQPMPMSVAEFDAFLRKDVETQRDYVSMAQIRVD